FLLSGRGFVGRLGAIVDERFLGIRGLLMRLPYGVDQLFPGLPVHATVPAGVNRCELPLVFSGERVDRLGKSGCQSLHFSRLTLRITGLPKVGTQIEILEA